MMNAFEGPKTKPSEAVETIRDLHKEMREYVTSLEHDRKRLKRLTPRSFGPEEFEQMAFYPNIYDIEPVAIDDLRLAKEQNDEAGVERMRTIIRTFSWPSHGRTDAQKAAQLARDFIAEAARQAMTPAANPFAEQGAFSYADQPDDTKKWEEVAAVTGEMECRGDKVEAATRFVEKKIAATWKDFLHPYWSKNPHERPAWPDSRPHTDKKELPPELEGLEKKLTSLRMIRDQLYYQRLYPKLCAFGHAGIKK